MSKKNILIVIIFLVLVGLLFSVKVYDLDFLIDVTESDTDLGTENIVLNAKLIRFPFNLGIIYGQLTIDQTVFRISHLKIMPKGTYHSSESYEFNLKNKDDQELLNGYAILMGDLDEHKSFDIRITFNKMDLFTGKSRTEYILGIYTF